MKNVVIKPLKRFTQTVLITCGMGLQRLLVCLPFKPTLKLAGHLGVMVGRLTSHMKWITVARANLAHVYFSHAKEGFCKPTGHVSTPTCRGLSAASSSGVSSSLVPADKPRDVGVSPRDVGIDVQSRLRAYTEAAGQGIVEMAYGWWANEKTIQRLLGQVSGIDTVYADQRAGKGVILCVQHTTHFYLLARFISLYFKEVLALYPTSRHPTYTRYLIKGLSRTTENLQPTHGAMQKIIKTLREGGVFFYPADVNLKYPAAEFMSFLGQPALISTIPTRLAQKTNAEMFVVNCTFNQTNTSYNLSFERFDRKLNQTVEDQTQALVTQQCNALQQQSARYFWSYQKFKYQPEGQPRMYPYPKKQSLKAFLHTVKQGEILHGDLTRPSIVRHPDGFMIKCFYKKPFWSKTKKRIRPLFFYNPQPKKFVKHARACIARGIQAPNITACYSVKTLKCTAVHYDTLSGEDVRTHLQQALDVELLKSTFTYLALLHEKGIFFRGIHLGNILKTAPNEFALIDVSDCYFYNKPLTMSRRVRNIKHMLKNREDKQFFNAVDVSKLLAHYCEAADISLNTFSAAFNVKSITDASCLTETNPASNAEGAK